MLCRARVLRQINIYLKKRLLINKKTVEEVGQYQVWKCNKYASHFTKTAHETKLVFDFDVGIYEFW